MWKIVSMVVGCISIGFTIILLDSLLDDVVRMSDGHLIYDLVELCALVVIMMTILTGFTMFKVLLFDKVDIYNIRAVNAVYLSPFVVMMVIRCIVVLFIDLCEQWDSIKAMLLLVVVCGAIIISINGICGLTEMLSFR